MKKNIALLQLKNHPKYQYNLEKILSYINELPKDAIIVAPEVCLTDYDYENLEKASAFSYRALDILLQAVNEQILTLTLLLKEDGAYVNKAVVLHKHKVVHSQNKHKLFKMGNEHHYLKAGKESEIKKFEIDGVTFGLLICFEMRYKKLWQKLEGADIILAPSQWGLPRKKHLEIIPHAMAIMNQCYVLVANSAKEDMAKSSAVFTPFGGVMRDDYAESIESRIDLKQVELMRKYIKL